MKSWEEVEAEFKTLKKSWTWQKLTPVQRSHVKMALRALSLEAVVCGVSSCHLEAVLKCAAEMAGEERK